MIEATLLPSADAILPMREQQRQELNCQIVHDSVHTRRGWSQTYLLRAGGADAGFGSVAIGGSWTNKPTIYEFHLLPAQRHRAFALFEGLLESSGAGWMEVQSNQSLLTVMLHTYAEQIATEALVFADGVTTHLPANGAVLHQVTPPAEIQGAIEERAGGGEWRLEVDGETAGTGGILFHYNRPFGDVFMDIVEPMRRRGYGAYLVQEIKRLAYELGSIPAARCNSANLASRRTLQKAGFVPNSHILVGVIARR